MNQRQEMSDYDYLALKLVQAGKRYPDTIGLKHLWADGAQKCIVGYIGGANGLCTPWGDERIRSITRRVSKQPEAVLMERAIKLNDAGTPWGQIPKLLGLVPGEADAQDLDSLDGVDRGRLSGGVPAVSEPAPDGEPLSLVEV